MSESWGDMDGGGKWVSKGIQTSTHAQYLPDFKTTEHACVSITRPSNGIAIKLNDFMQSTTICLYFHIVEPHWQRLNKVKCTNWWIHLRWIYFLQINGRLNKSQPTTHARADRTVKDRPLVLSRPPSPSRAALRLLPPPLLPQVKIPFKYRILDLIISHNVVC